MQTRGYLLLCAVGVAIGALFAATEVRANPVPVAEPGPMSCGGRGTTMPDFTVAAVPHPTTGEWPRAVSCSSANPGKDCVDYVYTITQIAKLNINHSTFAASADQNLDSTILDGTNSTASVSPPGTGDTTSNFLVNAFHEYTIRFNSFATKSGTVHIVVLAPSTPRITTVLVGGSASTDEGCLIAGPGVGLGVPASQFTPIVLSQDQLVAGGKCVAHLIYDASGNVIDVTTSTPGCTRIVGPVFVDVDVDNVNQELRDNRSPTGITSGGGTCTTYGPPIPSPSRTICAQ